jgi:putative mRNA 3-end processing factor
VTHGFTATFSKYLNEIGIASEEVRTQYGNEEEEEPTPTTIEAN